MMYALILFCSVNTCHHGLILDGGVHVSERGCNIAAMNKIEGELRDDNYTWKCVRSSDL